MQGSICSPVLANVFAHYALDIWLTDTVPPNLRGQMHVVRYADDLCLCFTNPMDARRVLESLPKRLERFGLTMSPTKTRLIEWNKDIARNGGKQPVFEYLGFTFYLGKTKKGYIAPKVMTSGTKMRSGLKELGIWMRKFRGVYKMKMLWDRFRQKIAGHIAYFGVTHNSNRLGIFVDKARYIFFKWINRRSQRKSMSWEKFELFIAKHPLPRCQIHHNLIRPLNHT